MSIFDKMSRGRIRKPFFMALFTGPGVGKTTFAASFPKPFFFDHEESSHSIDVNRYRPDSYQDLMTSLEQFRDEPVGSDKIKEVQTVVFDTLDETERLIHKKVAIDSKKQSIDHIGWQKGYDYAINHWADIISICRTIRDKHNIHFVFLCHAAEKSKTDAEKGLSFSRYEMAMHKKAAEYVFGQVEMVLFAKKDIALKTIDDRTVAVDLDKRVLYTQLSAHYNAKNRIGLPSELPMPGKDAFNILANAYEKAFNETPDSVFQECMDEIKGMEGEKLRNEISAYCEKHRGDISIMRATLQRIKELKGDNK